MKFNKFIIFTFAGISFAIATWIAISFGKQIFNSSNMPTNPDLSLTQEGIVKKIDSFIQNLKPLEIILYGFAAEGASAKIWMQDSSVLKVEIESLHESGKSLIELFWENKDLSAAREQQIHYGADVLEVRNSKTPPKVMRMIWMEFSNGKIIKWLENLNAQNITSPEAIELFNKYSNLAYNLENLALKIANYEYTNKTLYPCEWTCEGASWESGRCRSNKCEEL